MVCLRPLSLLLFCPVLVIVICDSACRNSVGIKGTFQETQRCPLLNFLRLCEAGKGKSCTCSLSLMNKCQPAWAKTVNISQQYSPGFCSSTKISPKVELWGGKWCNQVTEVALLLCPSPATVNAISGVAEVAAWFWQTKDQWNSLNSLVCMDPFLGKTEALFKCADWIGGKKQWALNFL